MRGKTNRTKKKKLVRRHPGEPAVLFHSVVERFRDNSHRNMKNAEMILKRTAILWDNRPLSRTVE